MSTIALIGIQIFYFVRRSSTPMSRRQVLLHFYGDGTPGREDRVLMNHSFRINSTRSLSMLHKRELPVRPYVFLIERMTRALFFPGICVIKSSHPGSRNKRRFKIPGARKLRVHSDGGGRGGSNDKKLKFSP